MMKRFFVGVFVFVGFAAEAGVGTSLMQVAPVMAPGEFEIKAQADIVFSNHVTRKNGAGFNISPHIHTGIIDHFADVDAFIGTGTTDFQAGALGKFNLLPDLPGQIALSFLGGFSFMRDTAAGISHSGSLLTLGMLASKTIEVDFGKVSPYLGYEFEVFFRDDDTLFPNSLILGSRWELTDTKPWAFYSELNIALKDSNYALGIGASHEF